VNANFRLCYVDGPWAWFTTAELKDQWGDDWNDAPYEHNAEQPYAWREGMKCRDGSDKPPYELFRVAWNGPLETPDEWHSNSPYSVEDINAGAVAWLATARYASGPKIAIQAGTLFPDFVRLVEAAGGTVYLPAGTST